MSQSQFPSNWGTVKVKDVAKLSYGKALLANSRANSGNVLVYGSGGIVGKHDTSLSDGPSIIIGRKGNVGAIYLVDKPFWCIDTAFYLESISEMVDVAFLAHTLQVANLSQYTRSVAIPGIGREDIENVMIPLPPLPEQCRIVAILREADEIRKLRQEANEKFKKLYNATFQDFFENDIARADNDDFIALEKLLAIPLTSGFSPLTKDEPPGIPVFSLSAITNFGLDTSQIKYYPEENYHGKGDDLAIGDILITRSNTQELVGRSARYLGQPSPVIYPDLTIRIRLKNPEDSLYLESFLHSRSIQDTIQTMARGTSGSMKKISQGDINKFKIFWPPVEKRLAYTKRVEEIARQRELQATSLAELNILYQSLFSRAFTGELTASWREQHAEELALAARERDALLQGQVTFHFETTTLESLAPLQRDERREDLIGQLSQLQQAILDIFVGDTQVYLTANQFHDDYEEELQEKGFSTSQDRTKRELRTLAALGLIREVTLPVTDQPGRVAYATVYRYPQLEDETAGEDLPWLATRSITV